MHNVINAHMPVYSKNIFQNNIKLSCSQQLFTVIDRVTTLFCIFLLLCRLIFSDKDSRNLFLFLLLNLSMAFVELLYGIWTNR